MDDVLDQKKVETDQWYHELTQTDTGVMRVKLWSMHSGHLEPQDLLISSDVDEVMSPSALQALRWCESREVRAVGCGTCLLGPLCAGCDVWSPVDAIRKSRQSLQE